jgi:putative membrane protein
MPGWHPHFDVWIVLGLVGYSYWYYQRRIARLLSPPVSPPGRRQWTLFYLGLGLVWVVSEWPLHDLAETSLYSVHMFNHMVITLVGPALMIMGLTRGMADHLFGHRLVFPWLRHLARPVAAFAIYNLGMIITHWPQVVAISVTNQLAHFGFHLFLFLSAVLLWLPVLSPATVIPRLRPPGRLIYLFLNSILPTVPASFLTFSHQPLYPVYGDAALAFGLTAVEDQTIAGLIMKLGGTLLLWIVMAVVWFRWAGAEKRWDEIEQELHTPA